MPTDVKDVSTLEPPSPGDPRRSVKADDKRISLETCVRCLLVAPILCAYALMECLRWYRPLPPPPSSATVVALVALVYAICKVLTTWRVRKTLQGSVSDV